MNLFKTIAALCLVLLPCAAYSYTAGYRTAIMNATFKHDPIFLKLKYEYGETVCQVEKYRFKDGNFDKGYLSFVEHLDCSNFPGTVEDIQERLEYVRTPDGTFGPSIVQRYEEIGPWASRMGLDMNVFTTVVRSLDQNLKINFKDQYGNFRTADPISLEINQNGGFALKYEPVPKQGRNRPMIDIRNITWISQPYQ